MSDRNIQSRFTVNVHDGPLYRHRPNGGHFSFGDSTHLSILNELTLCSHIVPRHFNPIYKLPIS